MPIRNAGENTLSLQCRIYDIKQILTFLYAFPLPTPTYLLIKCPFLGNMRAKHLKGVGLPLSLTFFLSRRYEKL
jgi:hypothetical protein